MKLAICIPCGSHVHAKFTNSLAAAIVHFLSARIEDADGNLIPRQVETFMVSCSMLTQSRTMLVAEAVAWQADYLLWLDSDHVFPADTIVRLLSRQKLIVGCNYARRCIPTAPTAAKTVDPDNDHKNLVYTTPEKVAADLVEDVDHLGFGVCLIDMRAIDALQIRADQLGEASFLPLFKFDVSANGMSVIGEDVFFFAKLRDAGVPVYLDHPLSWEVGHIHDAIMTNAHAIRQEERWLEQSGQKARRYIDIAEELEAA